MNTVQLQLLSHPLTKTCTRQCWFIKKAYTENLHNCNELKDVELHNEMLNTVPGKLCLKFDCIKWTQYNCSCFQNLPYIVYLFQKAYTGNLHNCNDAERRSTSQWNPQHSACLKFDCIKWTQYNCSCFQNLPYTVYLFQKSKNRKFA